MHRKNILWYIGFGVIRSLSHPLEVLEHILIDKDGGELLCTSGSISESVPINTVNKS